MPTPLGHALAGIAAGTLVAGRDPLAHRWWAGPLRRWPAFILFAVLAMAPDLDLLVGAHSSYTHSLGAALIVGATVFSCARERRGTLAVAAAAAYSSHVLLDWLGTDSRAPLGIMALWPLSDRFYVSDQHWFMPVHRFDVSPGTFVRHNLRALFWEVMFLAPIVALVWWGRRRRR